MPNTRLTPPMKTLDNSKIPSILRLRRTQRVVSCAVRQSIPERYPARSMDKSENQSWKCRHRWTNDRVHRSRDWRRSIHRRDKATANEWGISTVSGQTERDSEAARPEFREEITAFYNWADESEKRFEQLGLPLEAKKMKIAKNRAKHELKEIQLIEKSQKDETYAPEIRISSNK